MTQKEKELADSDEECQAFKDAKAKNLAYIIEDGWIVRVYADNYREKIMKANNQNKLITTRHKNLKIDNE
jgi:hypothetical protein